MTTTATAAPAAPTTSTNDAEQPESKEGTDSLLTGQEGEETADSTEVERAMLEGFNRATGKKPENDDDAAAGKEHGDGARTDTSGAATDEPADLDPEVPGLGMKVSEVKARFGKLDTLEKTLASANGNIGYLKQQISGLGKGKPITKESLTKVREEFGDDYAEALAADLSAAGIGGGASVDEETLGRIVGERIATERESMAKTMEQRLVRARHADAADYFMGGKQNAEFIAFVGTLPAERQRELADSWDSTVINQALDEFKTQRTKLETEKGRQNRRIERATTPTTARGAPVAPPSADPIEAGWNNVKGRGRGNAAVGPRR